MKSFLVLIILLNSALASAQEAEFSFKDKNQKYPGKAKEGITITFTYAFTNTGDAPLIISDYKVTCPCTHVTYPTTPILPGQPGKITVTFDTTEKIGYQDRKIELISNASKSPHFIRFRVMVENKK